MDSVHFLAFDLGAMYWGSPAATAIDKDTEEPFVINSALVQNEDNGLIDQYSGYAAKVPVYPVLRMSLFVRLF